MNWCYFIITITIIITWLSLSLCRFNCLLVAVFVFELSGLRLQVVVVATLSENAGGKVAGDTVDVVPQQVEPGEWM